MKKQIKTFPANNYLKNDSEGAYALLENMMSSL
jgi:hypothetical protein